jgi:cell division septal protein FtsQ
MQEVFPFACSLDARRFFIVNVQKRNALQLAGAIDNVDANPRRAGGGTGARAARSGKFAVAAKALLISLVILLTLLLISLSPMFSVAAIEVSGNQYYSDDQIIGKSGILLGQNGFSTLLGGGPAKALAFRSASAERGIADACPYVKAVRVQYELPRLIRISVEERNKSVVAPYFGSGLLIDEEGDVVDIVKNVGDTDLPVVEGLRIETYELGEKIGVKSEACMDAVLALVSALRQADRGSGDVLAWEIRLIDVSDLKNIRLAMKSGLAANFGDGEDIYYRVSALKEIVFNGLEPGASGLVDFSGGARPVYSPNAAGAGGQPAETAGTTS